jgi:guanine deaminase
VSWHPWYIFERTPIPGARNPALTDLRDKTLLGTFFHAPRLGSIEILADTLIGIDGAGRIAAVTAPADPAYAEMRREAARAGALVTLPPGCFGLPGLVDLHVHAPQYPQLGTALHVPLEDWLRAHTFPLEARYADLAFAQRTYEALVEDLLSLGTTTALLFATIHQDATRLLVDICLEKGLRALVGKVAMDDPASCPDYYRDASARAALDGTAALIDYVRGHVTNREGLVLPVVTPRFIPSCTDSLLQALGELAASSGCHVQTHCSESDWEHGAVLARHGRSGTASLDGFGLLTRHTVLAHGNFVSGADLDLIRARGAGVAHCPLSNAYFANAVFPLRAALDRGVRVGLGSDVSGGPSASLLDNCRMAVAASRMLDDGVDASVPAHGRGQSGSRIDWRIDWKIAFHLATAGGADALDLRVGSFAPGRDFDAMVVDTGAPHGTIRLFDDLDDLEAVLQKIIYTASAANIRTVWVGGRPVAGTAPQ